MNILSGESSPLLFSYKQLSISIEILVYTDEGLGASPACVKLAIDGVTKALTTLQLSASTVVRTTSSGEICKGYLSNNKTKLLVMPGGRDLPFCQYLNGHGNQCIRKFIEAGGSYLGLCAGGYYGCEAIEFAKGDAELEICEQRELKLYPGIAIGPAFPGFCYNSMRGAQSVTISISKKSIISQNNDTFSSDIDQTNKAYLLSVYYNGGPYFTCPHSTCETATVLASYSTGQSAIVQSTVGSGRVILCGPHIEALSSSLNMVYANDSLYIADIISSIETTENSRNYFFTAIIKYLINR